MSALFPILAAVAALQAATPDIPVLDGAQAAPDCGGRADLAQAAVCVTAPLGRMQALTESYVSALREQHGWLEADGRDAHLLFIRRKPGGGGCEGLQMMGFQTPGRPPRFETPAYLAFAAIPGDLCAAASSSDPQNP